VVPYLLYDTHQEFANRSDTFLLLIDRLLCFIPPENNRNLEASSILLSSIGKKLRKSSNAESKLRYCTLYITALNSLVRHLHMARTITKSIYQQWARQLVQPQIYQKQWRELKSLQSQAEGLKRDHLLKFVSWNIDFSSPMLELRVATLMGLSSKKPSGATLASWSYFYRKYVNYQLNKSCERNGYRITL
jgi:hypothetical protein